MNASGKEDHTENAADIWQEHSLHFLEMAFRADRAERVKNPDGYGKRTGDCGDTVEFFLMLDGDRITSVSFQSNGCMNTSACANTVAHFVEGKTMDEAWEVTPEAVSAYLETLPANHFHCAELAVGALYLALSDAKEIQKSSWKKMYR